MEVGEGDRPLRMSLLLSGGEMTAEWTEIAAVSMIGSGHVWNMF